MTDLDNLRRGDRVVIPKGTPFSHATAPRGSQPPACARTTHVVKVHSATRPVVMTDYDEVELAKGNLVTTERRYPGVITWAGPGGYWREVHITDELREANAE